MRDECSHGSLRSKCLVCEVTAERDSAYAALDSVSGALMDSGTIPVPEDEGGYGDAVRALTGERDNAMFERDHAYSGIELALKELGVPGPGYPAPVAQAVKFLTVALLRPAEGEGSYTPPPPSYTPPDAGGTDERPATPPMTPFEQGYSEMHRRNAERPAPPEVAEGEGS